MLNIFIFLGDYSKFLDPLINYQHPGIPDTGVCEGKQWKVLHQCVARRVDAQGIFFHVVFVCCWFFYADGWVIHQSRVQIVVQEKRRQ